MYADDERFEKNIDKCGEGSAEFTSDAIEVYRRKREMWEKVCKMDKQVLYEILRTIPRGKVVTYGTLAEMLGNRAWARAVGNALHSNPDGEKYPCYKVVNSKGELSRMFAFGGAEEQKRRLERDGIVVENGKVDLKRYGYRMTEKGVQFGS